MLTSIAPITFVGLDVHQDSISVALFRPGAQAPDEDQIANTPEAVRRLVRRWKDPAAVRAFRDAGLPVVSVDAKKKELVGDFKNVGREWQPTGRPVAVRVHDLIDPLLGKAIPYGIYDIERNVGWASIGQDHDTATFAVESLRRWWHADGVVAYPHADRLLICCDAGGSNGYRLRLWKHELGRLATAAGLAITVCHLPPGTSKWNKIEHRLFSHISMNWRGRPLTSHEVIVDLIGATTTTKGLKGACPARPRRPPHQRPRLGQRAGPDPDPPAPVPRRVELHHQPARGLAGGP